MFVNWSDEKHAIGIPDIDAQHRELFLITNRLWEDHEKPDQQTLLRPLLKRLYAYTRYHFSTEEGMFRHYGYEAIAPHLHIHTGFTDRIRTYLQETRDGRAVNYNEILDTMVNWILFHIAGEDQKYAAWFRQKGIKPTVDYQVAGSSPQPGEDMLAIYAEKKLSLDITSLDNQHKELVRILQQANDLLRTSPERRKIFLKSVIQRLFYYSQFHFSFEEEMMAKQGWDGLLAHRQLHVGFIRRIQQFGQEYQSGTASLNQEIVSFLRDWTIEHILTEDHKFKAAALI